MQKKLIYHKQAPGLATVHAANEVFALYSISQLVYRHIKIKHYTIDKKGHELRENKNTLLQLFFLLHQGKFFFLHEHQ